jgi:hypothetical protein
MCYRRENLLQREIPVEKIDLYYNLNYIIIEYLMANSVEIDLT